MRIIIVLAMLAVSLSATLASAEPYFAQREGYKCSRCHVNRTGGGKRTSFGYAYGLTHLATFEGATPLVDPSLGDSLSIGANFRVNHTTVFAEKLLNTFNNTEGNLYLQAAVSPRVQMYVDLSVAQGNIEGREAMVILDGQSGWHIKAGYFLQPFGLRLWGDSIYTREMTGSTFSSPDLGLEVGWEGTEISTFLAVSNGAGGGVDNNGAKRVSLLTEWASESFRAGISMSTNALEKRTTMMGSTYLGATVGRLVWLADLCLLEERFAEGGDRIRALIGYTEVNLLLLEGLSGKLSYQYHDPATDVVQDQRIASSLGFQWFVTPLVATSLFYQLRKSVPQDEIGNTDLLTAELHLFF